MLHVGSDVQVAEFPVLLTWVNAVGQKDEDDFVFGVGPGEGACEAGVPERLLGGQGVASTTTACVRAVETSCAAVAGILLFGEFGVGGFCEEVHAGHLPFVEEELHDVGEAPGVRKDSSVARYTAEHSRSWVVDVSF